MTATIDSTQLLDQNGLKTGQALTIGLLVLGFVLNSWWLVALVAVCQAMGALGVPFAPYRVLYQRVLKASGLVQPRLERDNPQPHRFAMAVGAGFNGVATLALLAGVPVVGWLLVGIVVGLANLNFWLNFCLGCWMYYRFNRWGVPGFSIAPVQES